jgi:hypothetical protein
VKELAAECPRLREEIDRLRQLLLDNDIDPNPTEQASAVAPQQDEPRLQLTTPQKIALFRSLFRGREDVSRRVGKAPMDGMATHRSRSGIGKHTMPPMLRIGSEWTRAAN